ncbi:MAG TPA: histidine kinase [Cyclobacteriaceae bacterium]|nr:histidine kinase [Cyclobacteriaceae bacterium]
MSRQTLNKTLIVILHLCGWALLLTVPFRFLGRSAFLLNDRPEFGPEPGAGGPRPMRIEIDPHLIQIESIVTTLLLAGIFYLNLYVLVPRVLAKKGWLLYVLSMVLIMAVYLLGGYVARIFIFPSTEPFHPPVFVGLPNFFMIFGISLALRLMQDRGALEQTLKEQETEKLKSELAFLRSQVSPHFIFNVLNSVASLARKKSDKVEDAIIQLSQLMRYTLYTNQKVSIEKELEYITNYINLQKMRFGTSVQIDFKVNMKRSDLLIEPMLLIPFVENAFKHGVGLITDPIIIILLDVEDYAINFTVRNKFNPEQNETKDSSSGIGLQNVRRRLDLLYKDMFTLRTETIDDDWYVVELKLIAS